MMDSYPASGATTFLQSGGLGSMKKSVQLKTMLDSGKLITAPGAYDAISAFLVQRAGFPAAYLTGSGVSLSLLGHPDINTVSYLELKLKVQSVLSVIDIPLIVDIDTGFGGPLSLIRLVKEFEQCGVAAVQIEDQAMPKKCGHELGRKVVSPGEMCSRIRAITENRDRDSGILVIARTDARTSEGIEAAIDRANAYLAAGADVIFVESPETLDEVKQLASDVRGPVLFNNIEGGRSPFLTRETLERLKINMVIYPNSLTRIMTKSAQKLLAELRDKGTTEDLADEMLTHKDLWALFGHDSWVELEKKYLP